MYDEYDAAMTTLGMATAACRAKESPESRSAIARLESTHRPWRFWVVWEFVAIVFGADEDGFGDPALSGFSIVFLGPHDIAIRHANGCVSPPISGS